MWHASAAKIGGRPNKVVLRAVCYTALAGVGLWDGRQEWEEWTGYSMHIRRRLSPAEQSVIGDVMDCRGTAEAAKRLEAVRSVLPPTAIRLAAIEMSGGIP